MKMIVMAMVTLAISASTPVLASDMNETLTNQTLVCDSHSGSMLDDLLYRGWCDYNATDPTPN